MVRRMSAREAREKFADLLGSVYYTKEPVVVEKQGRPYVVVVSTDDYERIVKEREERFTVLDEVRARNRDVTPEEAEADAAREVAAVRQEGKARKSRSRRA